MNLVRAVRKLRGASAAELAGRGAHAVVCLEERLHRAAGMQGRQTIERSIAAVAAGVDWRASFINHRRRNRPRFFPGAEQRDAMRALFAAHYSNELRAAQRWADQALRHEISFFGETFTFADQIPWHEDPASGHSWPRSFHRSISHDGPGLPDIKYVWELSRHQFVLDLAKAYFLTGRAEYSAEARRLVVDWIAQNPYGLGVNWASPLEPAYRSLAWLWAYWYTIDDPALDAEAHAEWARGFHDAGRFLYRHLELYSSPYNHLLGEACALYAIAMAFPEFSEAARWRQRGRGILIDRLGAQFYPDGGTVEQATCYHHASLGFYLLAALLGRANGDDFPSSVWSTIERAIEFSVALMQPDGRVPAIGDTDDARPVSFERRDLWDFRAYPAAGAALFGRGDFKTAAARFHEDALWLLGPPGFDAFSGLPASPSGTSVLLSDSGYAVMRSDRGTDADFVCFDCGEQAGGLRHDDVPSAAHGHADCLSVVTWLGGQPCLVDAGFFTYNGTREWERYFRGTAAHNTIGVNGLDQAVHLEKMAWAHVPRVTLEDWRADGSGTLAAGSHDGYSRRGGVIHRRLVWLRPGGYVVIWDELKGAAGTFELNFQLAPMDGTLHRHSFVAAGRCELRAFSAAPAQTVMRCGGPAPGDGWIAPGLGVRQPAPRVTFEGQITAPGVAIMTLLADLTRVEVSDVPGDPLSAVVIGKGFSDLVQAADPARCADQAIRAIDTDAAVAICRLHDSGLEEPASSGGSYMTVDTVRLTAIAGRAKVPAEC